MANTNYDRIRNMSIDEMAEYITNITISCENCPVYEKCSITAEVNCSDMMKKWLESEVEE